MPSANSVARSEVSVVRDVVWRTGTGGSAAGTILATNATGLKVSRKLAVVEHAMAGGRVVRVVDMGPSPSIRPLSKFHVEATFKRLKLDEMEVFHDYYAFGDTITLRTDLFNPSSTETLVAATSVDGYSDYEFFYSAYSGWEMDSATIYVDGAEKAEGDATYGHTVQEAEGRIQTSLPWNWSSVTVTASWNWAPTLLITSFEPNPIPGTNPQLFSPQMTLEEV